jgi:ribosomal protein S16
MLKIRLAQTGAKNQLKSRLVVMEARSGRNGKVRETLGTPEKYNQERLDYWRSKGAQITPAVKKATEKDVETA